MSLFSFVKGQESKVNSCVSGGFSLVEMLFYIALLSLALLAVIDTLLVMTRAYGSLRATHRIEQDAGLSLERLLREIRDANDIVDGGSVLGSHPGKLLLNTTTTAGAPRTVEFSLSNGALILKEDGAVTGALTGAHTAVTTLIFRKSTTARSKGVKVEMTFQSGTGIASTTKRFYGTAVLRDSY